MENSLEKTKIICPNCGGEMDALDDKCPYCGHINPTGAEKKFFDELEEKRDELEELNESPEAGGAYSEEVKTSFVSVGKKVLIFAAIVVAIIIIAGVINKVVFDSDSNDVNYSKELAWQNEHFVELDELYDEGNYKELVDVINKYEENHELWNWSHYDFVKTYESHLLLDSELEELANNGTDKKLATWILYNTFQFTYRTYEGYIEDDNDLSVLNEISEDVMVIAHERLKFSDKQLKSFKKEVLEDGYINYDKTKKIAKKYYKQFR